MTDVDLNSLLADLAHMVRIPSVNPFGGVAEGMTGEARMADFYEGRMRELGMETHSAEVAPNRRNVWGRLHGRGERPIVMMVGHLDTVGVADYGEPFEPHIKNGRIYGRGSCDMKAGLAAYLEVARQMAASGDLKGDIIVAGVVDEEHAMTGSIDFGRAGPAADFAIVGEPTGLEIACAHKGQINSVLRCRGTAVHSSMPELGDNAILRMGRVLSCLERYAATLASRPRHEICGLPKLNVGVIAGGTNVSSVPDLCEIHMDRCTVPGETAESFIRDLRDFLGNTVDDRDIGHLEVAPPYFAVPPLDLPLDSPLTIAFQNAYQEIRKSDASLVAFPGSTDAPNLQCPSIICGPGHLAQCHSLDEYVEIAQVCDAARIYASAIRHIWST